MKAWKIAWAPGQYALIAEHAMGHLLECETLDQQTPPPYRQQEAAEPERQNNLLWNQSELPLLDLAAGVASASTLIGIVAFRDNARIEQGALALYGTPQRVDVPNQAIVHDAVLSPRVSRAVHCWVDIEGERLPIIDLDLLMAE